MPLTPRGKKKKTMSKPQSAAPSRAAPSTSMRTYAARRRMTGY